MPPTVLSISRRTFLTLPLLATAARAHSAKHGQILIGHAWALPNGTSDVQVFIPLANNEKTDDALVAARCDFSRIAEFRENNRYDMPALKQFDLASGRPLAMRPTANHIRLLGPSRSLKKGDIFPLVLDFLNAGEIEVQVYVEEKPGE